MLATMTAATPATITPQEARAALEAPGGAQLIDVREYPEYAAGHARGARLIPLGQVHGRIAEIEASRQVLVICKSGQRAARAAGVLAQAGYNDVAVVTGGTEGWIAAGLPVDKEAKAPWALERQVRLAAGLLVLVGLFVPPWPWLSAFVGAGLVFAALTNTCGMALLLARMPWNKPRAACAVGSCACK